MGFDLEIPNEYTETKGFYWHLLVNQGFYWHFSYRYSVIMNSWFGATVIL